MLSLLLMMVSHTLSELLYVKRGFSVHVEFCIHVPFRDEVEALVGHVNLIKFTIPPYVKIMVKGADDYPQKSQDAPPSSLC